MLSLVFEWPLMRTGQGYWGFGRGYRPLDFGRSWLPILSDYLPNGTAGMGHLRS